MSDTLRIEYTPLSQVRRWSRNPKKHDLGALADAIERYGFVDPPKFDPLLNEGAGGLVYGNGRDEALEWMKAQGRAVPRGIQVRDDGEWLIPVKYGVDAPSLAEAEALAIDHNNLTMAGGDFTAVDMMGMWEPGEYTGLLSELASESVFPLTVQGDDLDTLLGLATANTPVEDEPVEIAQEGETRVQPGDVWRVGPHIIACLDSTEPGNLDRVLGVAGRKPRMVVADPPYGIDIVAADGYVGGGEKYDYPFGGVKKNGAAAKRGIGTIGGDKPFGSRPVVGTVGADHVVKAGRYAPVIGDDSIDTAVQASVLCLVQYPDATHFWWGANNYAHVLPPSTCWIVWDKENTGNFADAELAWSNHKSAVRIFKHMWNGMLRESEHGRRTHPTQKPQVLFSWLYEKYGSPGDLILDPFLGSGPSLKAAHQMGGGRTVVGFELSPHYCDHILEWAEAHGLTCERVEL